ncbi:type II toxin-antitoxin system RelE/ParE family toxin [Dyella sp. LX-66]|uniref:type II toxin-antitoxin system RelE/ParE family toxin n=1 Tax=unclassified Dyella TaxID=2634549 RepID=UPI001BDFE9FC|nr:MULTISPECIES: type II toxin-antitoxin system RelE/ParE family toxin [unclassified Dyella]MBT2119312.1 type II toxin-antitoxin system RelE/ParE family toxin [Dyella sp. LX-1]MBT2141683.1 type II toxin-antitoxin system RelE/ParE family toxin [Dyella sp. LX-66]
MATVRDYIDQSGHNHYRTFFNALSAVAAAKVAAISARLATGNTSGLKSLGAGLAEWRLDWGPGLRIYVHQDGDELILLLGGSDKGDQQQAITQARRLVAEYKMLKKNAGSKAPVAAKARKGDATRRK